MTNPFTLFFDSEHEAHWLKHHSPLLESARLVPIRGRQDNPSLINELVVYDRPDVIVLRGERPVLTIEKTKEVPTGHNVGQRMARLVRSIECGVPVIYKAPFDARKHGQYEGPCYLNIRLLATFKRVSEIHGVPIVAVNTAVDAHHEIIENGSNDEVIEQILAEYLSDENFDAFLPAQSLMEEEYSYRLDRRPAYGFPPSTVSVAPTADLLHHFPGSSAYGSKLLRRKQSVVYSIGMTPEKCRREDPYTGMTFIYDYLMCRVGPSPRDKDKNLILSIPNVSKRRWLDANPNDASKKSSNWYATATMLALKDGSIFSGDGEFFGRGDCF
jgi:hypothetical protein